jgi:hypothetical protein
MQRIAGVAWQSHINCAKGTGRAAGTVEGIAQQRGANGGEVDPNLVRAARDEIDLPKDSRAIALQCTAQAACRKAVGCGRINPV